MQTFLDEDIRREGLRDESVPAICSSCKHAEGLVRCSDCVNARLLCNSCMCDTHAQEPCHRIKACIPS